jgi:hypothetical protein
LLGDEKNQEKVRSAASGPEDAEHLRKQMKIF